jgi:hypothetical protein
MPGAPAKTKRALCDGCLESFAFEALAQVGNRRLCEACAARVGDAPPAASRDACAPRAEVPPEAGGFLAQAKRIVIEGTEGRWWLPRLPLLVWLAYIGVHHLANPEYQSLFKPLNLGIHELGHFVFAPFGQFLEISGGTILQCLVPVLSVGMFLRQRDLFAAAFSVGWLATNLFDVAVYVGDARVLVLPLVSPGGGFVIHDWNFLLERLGWLRLDTTFAGLIRAAGFACMAAALAACMGTLWIMARAGGCRAEEDRPI